MARTISYSIIGALLGFFVGLIFNPVTIFSLILSIAICAAIGASVSVYMNVNHILDRPFWNRRDIDTVLSNSQSRLRLLPRGLRDKFVSWIQSNAQD